MLLFEAAAKITMNTSDFDKGINKSESKFKSFAAGMGKAITAAVGATTVALGGLTSKIVSTFGNYEQLTGGVETLFKDSGDKVKEYAQKAYQSAGLSANAYMETVTGFSASLISSLGDDTDKAADLANQAIVDMSD